MMMKPPKRMCQQTITLTLTDPTKTDEWGQPSAGKPVTIEHCVVQPQTIYSGSNNDRTIVANAVIFLYAGLVAHYQRLPRTVSVLSLYLRAKNTPSKNY